MKKYLFFGGLVVAIIIVLFSKNAVLGKQSYEFIKYQGDVIGTHTGTSTVGVAFSINSTGGQSATSSYISKIGGNKQWANYTFKPTAASSTANLHINIEGSNDDYCDATATSTTDVACVGDCVITSNINWYDASDHLKNVDASTVIEPITMIWTNPSSTLSGDEILLTDLNYECLRINISGSSTVLYTGLRTK